MGGYKNNWEILAKLKTANNDNHYLYNITMGIHLSLLVRLFIGLATHGLYILHWYLVAALSIIINKLVMNQDNESFEISKGNKIL
jgi:hypothetical protein